MGFIFQGAHAAKSKQDKYKAFMSACERFQPVFRHFLMERFPDPADWYNRRIAYTRSVATNSIGKDSPRKGLFTPRDSGSESEKDQGHVKTTKEKMTDIREMFRFRLRFCSLWIDLKN